VSDENIGSTLDCVVPNQEGTACYLGHPECSENELICVSDIQPDELQENYCTDIDEDCMSETPPKVTEDVAINVPFYDPESDQLIGNYDVQLRVECGRLPSNDSKKCYWTCLGGTTLSCYRYKNGGAHCPPEEND
jgi:hypothetical protein